MLTPLGIAQEKRTLTLEETIQLARKNSRSAKQSETQRNWDTGVLEYTNLN